MKRFQMIPGFVLICLALFFSEGISLGVYAGDEYITSEVEPVLYDDSEEEYYDPAAEADDGGLTVEADEEEPDPVPVVDEEEPDPLDEQPGLAAGEPDPAADELTETEEQETVSSMSAAEPAAAAEDVVGSGSCGKKLSWELTGTENDLTLTIFGRGQMDNYSEGTAPWYYGAEGQSRYRNIRTVIVKLGVVSVGDYAFFECVNLTKVELPRTLNSIGSFSFNKCVRLRSLLMPEFLRSIGQNAFASCLSLQEMNFPKNLSKIEKGVLRDCENIKHVTVPEGVTVIEVNAFTGCRALTEVDLPDQMKDIKDWAFSECSSSLKKLIP